MDNKKRTKVLMIVAVLTLLILVTGATYAYFTAQGGQESNVNMNVTTHTTDSLVFEVGAPISIYADQSNFANGMANQEGTTFAIATAKAGSNTEKFTGKYNIFFVIDENDFEYTTTSNTAELIMTVKDPNGAEVTSIPNLTHTTVKGVSGFDITTKKGTFAIAKEYVIEAATSATKIDNWEITVTLVNLDSNQNANTKKTFRGQLFVTKENMESYALPIVNTIETTVGGSGTELEVKAKVGASTAEVVNYYYAIEEASAATPKVKRLATTKAMTYEKSTSDTHTFTGLTSGKNYKVSIYTEDANGFKSPTYENVVATDNYVLPKITSVEASVGATNIDLTVNATQGNNAISKYFYKVDGIDTTYQESTSNKKSYTGLTTGETYTISIYTQDTNGRNSYVYTMKVTPEKPAGTNAAEFIKGLYITQGTNNLYHHDGTLENGINDGSYRYSGANYKIADEYKEKFDNVDNISANANGIIGMYCSRGTSYSYINQQCASPYTSYYYLKYDNNKIQYKSYKEAQEQALKDGYIVENINNFVCFGTDATICDDEHLYRIIGVFNEKIIGEDGNSTGETEQRIKLIKAYEAGEDVLGLVQTTSSPSSTLYKGKLEQIPGYYWSGTFKNGSSSWSSSKLKTDILNNENKNYLKILGTDWNSKIAVTEWKVAGNSTANISKVMISKVYQNEIKYSDSTGYTNNAKVGLMYASEYGFAASPENWTTTLYNYKNNTNTSNNWMYLGVNDWSITRNSDSTYMAFLISRDGSLSTASVYDFAYVVRPTFYLNSNVAFAGGTGTSADPYRIA